jgi:hypothetical protein
MLRFVAQLNIDHYREMLAEETDANKRKLLEQLLAEEEAKLAAEKQKSKEQKQVSAPTSSSAWA